MSAARLLLTLNHARAMYRTLRLPKNSRKGDWRGLSTSDLLFCLEREVVELKAAVWAYEHQGGSTEDVSGEAADVSNFAAMISDKVNHGRQR